MLERPLIQIAPYIIIHIFFPFLYGLIMILSHFCAGVRKIYSRYPPAPRFNEHLLLSCKSQLTTTFQRMQYM
jgi:hypothetical protein